MIPHERIYRIMASEYDAMISRQPDLAPALREIRTWTGLDVLDLGAGSGRLSRAIAPEARSLVCTDRSEVMLALLERVLEASGTPRNWRTVAADHRALPFDDGVFDVAVAGWTIGYVANADNPSAASDLDRILGELRRVLKPGGTIVIAETMGTGTESPAAPPFLLPYYAALEQRYGFSHRTFRMDYRFASPEEAKSHTAFFFGDALADQIERHGWSTVPEFASIWWKHF